MVLFLGLYLKRLVKLLCRDSRDPGVGGDFRAGIVRGDTPEYHLRCREIVQEGKVDLPGHEEQAGAKLHVFDRAFGDLPVQGREGGGVLAPLDIDPRETVGGITRGVAIAGIVRGKGGEVRFGRIVVAEPETVEADVVAGLLDSVVVGFASIEGGFVGFDCLVEPERFGILLSEPQMTMIK